MICSPTPEMKAEFLSFLRLARGTLSKKADPKLELSVASVMAMYEGVQEYPKGRAFFPILRHDTTGEVLGFAILQEMFMPKVVEGMVSTIPYGFIWALYKTPTTISGKSVLGWGNHELISAMVGWAKERGHHHLAGNCSPDFCVKAARRYGFQVKHLVMELEVAAWQSKM